MNEDGTMSRVPQLLEFCRRYGMKMISVAELIRYRLQTEKFIQREAAGRIENPARRVSTIRYVSRARQRSASRRWSMATSPARATCWCACIPIASTATCSLRRMRLPPHYSGGFRSYRARRRRRFPLSAPNRPWFPDRLARWQSPHPRPWPNPPSASPA